MNSLYRIVVVLAAIALIGSTGASLQQQAFAQGVILEQKEQFTKLTDEFEKAVLGALDDAGDPPGERIQAFLSEYDNNVKALFELEPPDPDLEPPDPDLEPPDPDKS